MDRAHHLRATLQERHGRAHGHLLVHVPDVHVGDAGEALAALHEQPEQLHEDVRRLLDRERDQVLPEAAAGRIDVPKLARRIVLVPDPHPAGLEAGGQVSQGAGIDQLAQD